MNEPTIARSLTAWVNQVEVGTLKDVNGIWSFQYAQEWRETPLSYALSPHLPCIEPALLDGSTKRHVQWYFDNLLPEERQRVLLAGDAKLDVADAFGLLAWYGAESAGSVTLLAPDEEPQTDALLRPLDYNEVRPHGTIGRIPPAAFAAKHRNPNPTTTDAGSVNLQPLGPLSN